MAQRKETRPNHDWIGASFHPLSAREASWANRYGEHETTAGDVVEIVDVICRQCRQPYDAVAERVCEPSVSGFDYLFGGPTGRRKRKHDHDCSQHGCGGKLSPERAAELRRLAADPTPRRRAL